MLRVILLPLLAVLGGAGGFFLRRWGLATAFEPSGLAIPGAPATIALIILSAAVAAALALLCRGARRQLEGYDDAFAAQGNWLYLALTAVGAAHLLLAGVFDLMAFFRRELHSLPGFSSPYCVWRRSCACC